MRLSKATRCYLDDAAFLRGCNERTLKAYASALRQFAAWFGGEDPDLDAAGARALDYLVSRGRASSENTRRQRTSVLRHFFRWASENGHAEVNPLRNMRLPRVHSQRRVYLTRPQIYELLRATARSPRAQRQRDHAFIAVLYFAGLRVTEALTIRVADANTEARTIRVLAKGGQEMKVGMTDKLARILGRWLAAHPGGPWLFPGRYLERHLSQNWASTLLRDFYAPGAGLAENVTPHVLRRSAGEIMDSKGESREDIRRFYRHKDQRTTDIYVPPRPERATAAAARVL